MSQSTDPCGEFAGLTDADLFLKRNNLSSQRMSLERVLGGPTAETVVAEVERVREKAATDLAKIAKEGLDAARNSSPGTRAWSSVEHMVTAAVLASPVFAEVIAQTLAASLPAEEDVAAQRAKLARVDERTAAIDAEVVARQEDAHRAYMDKVTRAPALSIPIPGPRS